MEWQLPLPSSATSLALPMPSADIFRRAAVVENKMSRVIGVD